MCAVSNMGDLGRTVWPNPFPGMPAQPYNPGAAPWQPAPYSKPYMPYNPLGQTVVASVYNGPTKEQFEEFLTLLRAAKRFDTLLGMKDCEMAEKLEWLKAIATHLGVDIKDLVS